MMAMEIIEKRALYNLLRMNWLNDPRIDVEPWQVEDYRSAPIDTLFDRLRQLGFHFERTSFIAHADACDAPEELAESLFQDDITDAKEQDQIYLIIFELWRRLVPEKPCLSIFCDELDHQIHLFDRGEITQPEHIQDIIAELQVVLNEHVDKGIKPIDAFDAVTSCCANDIATFLYDFIAEQIDTNNDLYASDLLEAFTPYIKDKKWFTFLKARLLFLSDPISANLMIKELVHKHSKNPDLEFNLEILSSMVQYGQKSIFNQLLKDTIPLLKTEEDLQDLLSIYSDFAHYQDDEEIEKALQESLKNRSQNNSEAFINQNDVIISSLKKLISVDR